MIPTWQGCTIGTENGIYREEKEVKTVDLFLAYLMLGTIFEKSA